MYNDNYETCHKTYLTLRIYTESILPEIITELLGILPSHTQSKEQTKALMKEENVIWNGWFLTTENSIDSKDCRRHIDYIAEILIPIKEKLNILIDEGAKIDLSCFWASESGQGGPTISKQQMSKLAELGIEIFFDIY